MPKLLNEIEELPDVSIEVTRKTKLKYIGKPQLTRIQEQILKAPATLIITAIYERTTKKYGERGIRYVHMEVGSVAENVYLQAESLKLGTVFIGAFDDQEVKEALGIAEEPLAIMPVGKK